MRFHRLLTALLPSAFLLLHAGASRAAEPTPRAASRDDDSIGTRPARSSEGSPAAAPQPSAVERSYGDAITTAEDVEQQRPYETDVRHPHPYAPIATDPPGDWAVLHAGLRPHLGTFGGIATFAVAHARTERFYGVFSLSAVRNDAGTHVGVAQLALGRNLADSFGGGAQLSVSENRARHFHGLAQASLGYNRALAITAVTQLAAYNRAKRFSGVAQLGAYNRTDESFAGAAQLGAFNHARGSFTGLVQLGVVNASGPELLGDAKHHGDGQFTGLAQIGALSSADGNFYGFAQVGGASYTAGSFRGLVQIGALGAGATSFHGLAQIGAAAVAGESKGIQLGAATLAFEEHTGLQLGGGNYGKHVDGAQVGIVNLGERVRGVQIGVFNHARSLRGVQIGLANHAEDGVLPWTALLNMGFGDAPDAGYDDEDDRRHSRSREGRSHF